MASEGIPHKKHKGFLSWCFWQQEEKDQARLQS